MFNGSFLRVCRILRFVRKLDFAFLSLGGPRHGARVWCLARVPKHRNQWQEVEGLLFSPQKLSVGAYFELLFLGCGFLIHLSNMSYSPRFRASWKKIRPKIRDTIGTVFIQGPYIVLLVWRSIMFNGSYLRACMKLQIVQKIRFSLLESGRTKPWCPGFVSRPSAKA